MAMWRDDATHCAVRLFARVSSQGSMDLVMEEEPHLTGGIHLLKICSRGTCLWLPCYDCVKWRLKYFRSWIIYYEFPESNKKILMLSKYIE